MNITPVNNQLPLQTAVNVQTDSLRRENHQREVINKPEAPHHSVAEKGVASDKDKARTTAQQNEHIDFSNIRKQAELLNNIVGDHEQNDGESSQTPFQQADDEQENNGVEQDDVISHDDHHHDAAEQQEIKALQQRDREVRAHELAHAAVGGAHTGSPSYSFEVGPDGKKYAVSGEVSVDVTPIKDDPRATIAKMKKVHAAALAPVNPSPQDLRVAATAAQHIREAQAELAKQSQNVEEQDGNTSASSINSSKETFSSRANHNQFAQSINHNIESTQSDLTSLPERSLAVEQRSLRIEQFYHNINQAHEKSINHNFELIA